MPRGRFRQRPDRLLRSVMLAAVFACAASLQGCGSDFRTNVNDGEQGAGPENTLRHFCTLEFSIEAPDGAYEEVAVVAHAPEELGSFVGQDGRPSCTSAYGPVFAQEHVRVVDPGTGGRERMLVATVDDPAGIPLTTELLSCAFYATRVPAADDIGLEGAMWQPVGDFELLQQWRWPLVEVSSIECSDWTPPASTTSTTLAGCDAEACLPDGLCEDGACVPGVKGRVEVRVESSSKPLASMQIQIDYGDSGAVFAPPGQAACEAPAAAPFFFAACNSVGGPGRDCEIGGGFHPGEIGLGFIAVEAVPTPFVLASCSIVARDTEALEAAVERMRIELIDARDPEIGDDMPEVVVTKSLLAD